MLAWLKPTQSGSSTQSRLAPEPVIARCSFDHLVGKVEDTRRDRQAKRLGGLEVDDQRVFRWLLNPEVGRTGALEDAVNVGCRLRVQVGWVERVRHQATGSGKI